MKIVFASLLLAAAPAIALPRVADSAAHGYVLGRFADADDRLGDAARYYDEALKAAPGDATLLRRTFETAVAAGDEKLAFALARQIGATPASDSTVALVRLAEALKRRDWSTADAVRPGLADAGYAAVVGPIVQAWTLAGRGRIEEALAVAEPDKFKGIARSYVVEHRALILSAARRWAEATPLFTALLTGEARGVARLRIAGAEALRAQGRVPDALVLLDAGPRDATVAGARRRIAANRPAAEPIEPRVGVAWLVARLAGDLAREKPVPLALVFARVSTFLAPEAGDTWLITGDVLARGGRNEAAIAAYARIATDDPLASAARARQALALSDDDRDAEARAMIEAATAAPQSTVDDWVRLGDFERKLLRHDAAARAYERAIERADDTTTGKWTLYFLRGGAFEQGGDWVRAEPDLRAALALAPTEPAVLNYLGYALLDRNLKLGEAQRLIEEASRLKPDDGFITDSLGWTYVRTGQVAKAVPVLERAVALEPGDPTINEHLGDAYWRAGRRIEARFRWRATLDLGPTPAQTAAVKAKLDYGLDVALALAAAPPAKP